MKKIRKLLRNERGQGMLEYVLLVGVLAILIVIFKGQISGMIQSWTGKVQSKGDEVFQSP